MEFKEFYQKYRRMCESYKNCKGCPRDYKGCLDFGVELNELDELENDVEQWSKEHSPRTRLQDLLEKFPKVEIDKEGLPFFVVLDWAMFALVRSLLVRTVGICRWRRMNNGKSLWFQR